MPFGLLDWGQVVRGSGMLLDFYTLMANNLYFSVAEVVLKASQQKYQDFFNSSVDRHQIAFRDVRLSKRIQLVWSRMRIMKMIVDSLNLDSVKTPSKRNHI